MIEIYYTFDFDKTQNRYSIVLPYHKNEFPPYYNYWIWYYLGHLTKGDNTNPHIIPFACTWDENWKLIKTYKANYDAEKYAKLIFNFIKKHSIKYNP